MPELLNDAAEATRGRVVSQADRSACDTGTRDFRVAATSAVMGTAVRAFKLDMFHRLGRIASARELSEHHPDRPTTTSSEDWYSRSQGPYYAMRNAFEEYWIGGRQAIYFALLLTGPAPPDYGDYTLVVDPARVARVDLGCFPGNTAERYAPSGVLDEELCTSEIATWDLRGDLLTIKHGTSLSHSTSDWPIMVCGSIDFSETVCIGSLPLAAIIEIRVDRLKHKRWRALRMRMLRNQPLNNAERDEVWILDLLSHWRDAYGPRIVDA